MQVTEKGQITLPKHLRDSICIQPGSRVFFMLKGVKIIIQKTGTGNGRPGQGAGRRIEAPATAADLGVLSRDV